MWDKKNNDPGCLCAGGNDRGPYFLVFLFLFFLLLLLFFFFFLMINKENNPKGQSVEEVVKLRLCSSDIQLARSERQPFPYVPDKSWDP